MTFALIYFAGFLIGWQGKLMTFRRQAVWYTRQDTQAAREWRERHGLS